MEFNRMSDVELFDVTLSALTEISERIAAQEVAATLTGESHHATMSRYSRQDALFIISALINLKSHCL